MYDGDDYPMLMSLHLSICARLLLASPRAFNELAAAVAAEENKAHSEVVGESGGREGGREGRRDGGREGHVASQQFCDAIKVDEVLT